MKLREIAHSRTGDKGNIANVSVIAYNEKDYALLLQEVTVEKVKKQFSEVVKSEIIRYEVPSISALNFVMQDALGGGVTRSLAIDKHGKSLGGHLLDMSIKTN